MGETKTQIVAQLEADIAFLMPSDRHGQESLNRRLKADLTTFKGLVESGVLGGRAIPNGASSKRMSGRSELLGAPSPAAVAARIRNRNAATPEPSPGAGWDTGAADRSNADPTGTGMGTPGLGGPGMGAGGGGGAAGTARMGGRTAGADMWGDGMINEEERGRS